MVSGLVILTSIPRCHSYAMPFFSDYGYYHGSPSSSSVPFSSQYYGHHQLLLLPPYSTSNSRPAAVRTQTRNYNAMAVEQTLRAIRRGPGPASARRYCRPVHINASEIDVTTPRRPRQPAASETVATVTGDETDGGGIHRGRTVVRLHTKNNNSKRTESWLPAAATTVTVAVTTAPAAEEGLAKKGTIKRHTSAGIKVPVNDDRRPSVTDEILREQEALFDTMIMEEMEGQRGRRRKSYPVDCVAATMVDGKQQQKNTANGKDGPRKQSAAAVMMVFGEPLSPPPLQEKPTKKPANWKLNYDVIIEESGIEQPVSFTFKLNKTNDSQRSAVNDTGKVKGGANLSNVVLERHDDNSNNDKKHAKANNTAAVEASDKNNSDHVCMTAAAGKPGVTKKKIIVKKKKAVGKKDLASGELRAEKQPKRQTVLPPKPKEKGPEPTKAVTVITPFVRASFGKTFISPSQVSSTKSKFEKPKPKAKPATAAPEPPAAASTPVTLPPDSSSDDDSDTSSSSGSDGSSLSLCSDSGDGGDSSSGSSSTYYDSDDYGDKRIACSNSSFDSGLPSSPVPAPEPLGMIPYDPQTKQDVLNKRRNGTKILWKNDRKCHLLSFGRIRS